MESLQAAISIVFVAGVVTILGFVIWNDVWRPRKRMNLRDQQELDRAKHGVYLRGGDHMGGGGGVWGGGGDGGGTGSGGGTS